MSVCHILFMSLHHFLLLKINIVFVKKNCIKSVKLFAVLVVAALSLQLYCKGLVWPLVVYWSMNVVTAS